MYRAALKYLKDGRCNSSGTIRRVAVLGSTGTIGESALRVIKANSDKLELVACVAGGNLARLEEQMREFSPKIGIATLKKPDVDSRILFGPEPVHELLLSDKIDFVLFGISGFKSIDFLLSAIKGGKLIGLANKECLVGAGEFVAEQLLKSSAAIIPVDSEHSALFQLIAHITSSEVSNLTITASGGPFLDRELSTFSTITPAEAVKHPKWKMGAKISVDSATMANKALELIEAQRLFSWPTQKLSVLIHPESIVHGILTLQDGVQLLQASVSDMCAPISYALSFGDGRFVNVVPTPPISNWQFREVDTVRFPVFKLGREALTIGGNACLIYNTANEVAVEAFLKGEIKFTDIHTIIQKSLERHISDKINLLDYRALLDYDEELRLKVKRCFI